MPQDVGRWQRSRSGARARRGDVVAGGTLGGGARSRRSRASVARQQHSAKTVRSRRDGRGATVEVPLCQELSLETQLSHCNSRGARDANDGRLESGSRTGAATAVGRGQARGTSAHANNAKYARRERGVRVASRTQRARHAQDQAHANSTGSSEKRGRGPRGTRRVGRRSRVRFSEDS